MSLDVQTRVSTPVSPASTLSVPSSPWLKGVADEHSSKGHFVSASTAIEFIASKSSSSVFVYDLAEQAGFGTHTKSWQTIDSSAAVVSLQTRAGAGLSLVGRLSQGSSRDGQKPVVLTAYTTPTGVAAMMQSLSYLPTPTANNRLILQVPTVTPVGESFALSPTLAPFTPSLAILPEHFTILLSSTPQEALDLALLSYELANTHVIHFFDHHSVAREVGHNITLTLTSGSRQLSLEGGLALSGYKFFDYVGDKNATTVLVVLNGPLANAAKAFAARVTNFGVVVVRVLRPWSEEALREIIPSSAKRVHVLDDVPSDLAQGALYVDVFSALLDPLQPGPVVKSQRVTPTRTQSFLTSPSSFIQFLAHLEPSLSAASLDSANQKKLLFFGTPGSALSTLPAVVQQTFAAHPTLSVRLLTDHDILSKPGLVTADRILLSTKEDPAAPSVAFSLPITPDGQGSADFVAVTDQALLKSHSVVAHAKPGSPLLIVTSWTPAEVASNLPTSAVKQLQERNIHIYTIDAQQLAEKLAGAAGAERDAVENVFVLLAFLRLYLGKAATEEFVVSLARRFVGNTVSGFDLTKIGARAWRGLFEIELPAAEEVQASTITLKHFEFNAVAIETDSGDTVVNGARLGSWHDAAKHLLFASAFTPSSAAISSYDQNPALRPELPERTFLITTTVNRRLTPLEYDRNVFHLEFDTRGTGLKYAIGEALGVHGWNDEQEVLDFCSWYGVDPSRLITIPVPGTDGARMHTRTVFQALQQQIDLFGKPTKTFYSELANYAASQADKYALQFIGSPEGSATFKKLAEKDTVNFADILRKYETARPGIETLCELIGDIKPRHYSIASSQSVVGDRVDLLVVSVDWVTPSGKLLCHALR